MKKRKLENGSEVPEINTNPKKTFRQSNKLCNSITLIGIDLSFKYCSMKVSQCEKTN